MADRRIELGDAELEVLRVLWEEGPCTVRQVLRHLHDAGRRVAYTTVLTFLTRLEQKGLAASDKTGIAYVYRATVSQDKIRRSRLRELVSQLYDGEAAPLVLQLMKSQKFTKQELAVLRKLIKELDSKAR
ncbi:MAG: BlaI/MecI/CopY family transcriptional regulator [Planctomycetota bacterium]